MMNETEIYACLNDLGVQSQVTSIVTSQVTAQIMPVAMAAAQQAGEAFGGAGVVTGVSIPLIAGNLFISLWRIITNKRNIRAYVLLGGAMGSLIGLIALLFGVLQFYGRTVPVSAAGLVGFVIQLICVNVAGTFRFAVPLRQAQYRRIFTFVSIAYAVAVGVAVIAKGLLEMRSWAWIPGENDAYSYTVAVLCTMELVWYAIAGFVCFSWELRKTFTAVAGSSSGTSKLKSLEIANHALMGFVCAIVVLNLALGKKLVEDATFNSCSAILFCAFFLLSENIFEFLTSVVDDLSQSQVGRSHADTKSRGHQDAAGTLGA
ncbi:hypothetical protein SpCBS45565_g00864 [Spizellomyces sp. 'palustris']|nr:hypothetical protein SpCBS45565_g00864 [Spizellomyces sp. 'palustris']